MSDAEREATVQRLQRALARSLLTFDEAGQRMTAAYAARFGTDLARLTADLPPAAGASEWEREGGPGPNEPTRAPVPRRGAAGVGTPERPVLLALLTTVAVVIALMVVLVLLALLGIALRDLLSIGRS